MLSLIDLRERRKRRVRYRIRLHGQGRPRLSVFRSNKHIYAQLVDDTTGTTIAAASTLDKGLRDSLSSGGNREAAAAVGKLLAERAAAKGVSGVVFDRGAYPFHGRIRALAEAAREAGLSF